MMPDSSHLSMLTSMLTNADFAGQGNADLSSLIMQVSIPGQHRSASVSMPLTCEVSKVSIGQHDPRLQVSTAPPLRGARRVDADLLTDPRP